MEYVRAQKLGGAMAWSLDSDDENGSLMQAIADGLGRNKEQATVAARLDRGDETGSGTSNVPDPWAIRRQ
jgi:hypothetical protein